MTATSAKAPFQRIGVAGLGLIGGSVALAARATWPGVDVIGCDTETCAAEATRRQVVREAARDITSLRECDLIVLAVPLVAMPEALGALADMRTSAVVTDVASTKRRVVAEARAGGLASFVGGHPMAGAERPGLDHARADLFVDRPWLLVEGTAGAADRARVESFVRALGARPSWIDAAAHDRAVAYVSHLPQVLAAALMAAADEQVGAAGAAAAGPAFAEMTRLASSPTDMWQAILSENADYVTEALTAFAAGLPGAGDLASGAWVRDVLARAGEARGRWRDRSPRP
jgi:prephenate dehydrogenase